MPSEQVFLRCSKDGGKLRVRIISPGYFGEANCQFPRSIRSDGQLYLAEPRSIRLVQSRGGRNFYRIAQPITLCGADDVGDDDVGHGDEDNDDSKKATGKKKRATGGKRRQRSVEKPKAVFDHKDEPDCVVCLDTRKEQIFVPCGHFCMCKGCIAQLVQPKKCPMCREPIKTTILPSEL